MKKMNKVISLLLCMLLVIGMLSACKKDEVTEDTSNDATVTEAPDTSDTTEAADPTDAPVATEEPFDLTLGIWPEDTMTADIELHEGYVKKFNAIHPNVTVVPAFYHYALDTFVPLVESGGLPVLFDTWYTEPTKLIAGDFVADITDILEDRGWLDKINPSIRELLSKDGRCYGIPRDGYALGIMVNVDLFEQAGLVDADGIPLFPKTWDELAQTAKTIKDTTGQAGFDLLAMDAAGGWHFTQMAWCWGASFTTQDADGKFVATVDTPEAIAAMEYVKSLKWTYDCLMADPTAENWGTGFDAIGTGTAAMYIAANDSVDRPTQINGLPVDKLAMGAIPKGPTGLTYTLTGGTPYMFSKDATPEQINAALDYLEIMGRSPFLTDDSLQGLRDSAQSRVENGVPVIPRFPCWVSEDIKKAEDEINVEFSNIDPRLYAEYYDSLKQEGNLRLEEPGLTQDLYAQLNNVIQAVITDENADVAALMKTADENYQTLLDTNLNNAE